MEQELRNIDEQGGPKVFNGIERDFLSRLTFEAWTSPPLFDHQLVERIVNAGYATRKRSNTPQVSLYEITDAGRAALDAANKQAPPQID